MLNALLENYRLTINAIDVTNAVNGQRWLDLNYPKVSETGLFPATGQISLLPIQGFPANFFNPRKNRSQWKRGNPVKVELMFGGVWLDLFNGFILNRPKTPTQQSPVLNIPIGCELAFRNRESEAGDKAGVNLGNTTSRTTIIGNIWAGIGGGTWAGNIPKHPIPYNLPKHSGSYVDQMGAVAIGGMTGLYVDRLGNLQAASLSLSPTELINRTNDNSFLEPVDGSEAAAEEVKVAAVGREVLPTEQSRTIGPIIETGILLINLGLGVDGTQVLTGTTKRTIITEQWSADFKTKTTTTSVETPFYGINFTTYELRLSTLTVVQEAFSEAKDGKLLSRTTTVSSAPLFAGINEGDTFYLNGIAQPPDQPIQRDRVVERWTYDGEIPATHLLEDYDIAYSSITGGVLGEEYLQRRLIEQWTDLGNDDWLLRIDDEQRLFLTEDTLYPQGKSGIFQGAEYAPREPRRHSPYNSSDEVSYTCSAFFSVDGLETEPAIYEFQYGVSNEQCEELADFFGALLIGRESGWQHTIELDQNWVENWNPGSGARVTLPDGDVMIALIDGVNISLDQNYGIVSFGLAELGVVGSDPSSVIPPYIQRTTGDRAGAISGGREDAQTGVAVETFTTGDRAGGTSGARAEDATITDGDRAGGTSGAREGATVAILPGSTTQVLSVARGGTGGFTAAQARQNLGLSIAGGDLTGSYPNPVLRSDLKPLNTVGDIYVYGPNGPTRLPGPTANGQVLTADLAEPTNMKWV